MRFTLFIILAFLTFKLSAQPAPYIFQDRKIINSFSTETLEKRILDFRILHRFGDIAGNNGGWQNFYGLENAQDISIGFDYGLRDDLLIGFNRAKGAGPLKRLVNAYVKYKVAGKNPENFYPTAVTFLAYASLSTMPKSDEENAINFFPKFIHRMTYHIQGMVARKFTDNFSGQFNFGYTHRNYVNTDEENVILNIGLAGRLRISRSLAIILEGNYPIRLDQVDTEIPLGIGLEWETGGGHIFQINLTNSSGLSEPDYLGYTRSSWQEGEFRLGFTISRKFRL